jgi:hypothetical protein
MEAVCEKCQGAAGPAAQMKIFEYEGHPLHCIAFVSSCTICGHRWEDPRYTEVNLHHAERACAAADGRQMHDSPIIAELRRRQDSIES